MLYIVQSASFPAAFRWFNIDFVIGRIPEIFPANLELKIGCIGRGLRVREMKVAFLRNEFGLPGPENAIRDRIGQLYPGRSDPDLSRIPYFSQALPN